MSNYPDGMNFDAITESEVDVYYKRSVDGEDVANALSTLESAIQRKNQYAIRDAVNALWDLITEEA